MKVPKVLMVAVAMTALASLPGPASAALYKFVQTGVSTTPFPYQVPPTFTVTIEVNGTLNDLPTISSDPFSPGPTNVYPFHLHGEALPYDPDDLAPIDYGNLLAISISTTAGLFDTTLADFGYPSIYFDYPQWSISPQRIYLNSAGNDYEFWIDGFGDNSVIGHRADGGTCMSTAFPCEAPGRWVPVHEPGTLWMLAASIIVLSGCAQRRRALGALAT